MDHYHVKGEPPAGFTPKDLDVVILSIFNVVPIAAEEKRPQIMMFPPPCFTFVAPNISFRIQTKNVLSHWIVSSN